MVGIVSPLSTSAGTRAGANIRAEYHGLIAVGTISDACYPKAIQGPCPDIFLVLLNGKGMAHAAADKPALFVQTEGGWEKGIVTLALENAMAEPILLVRSPDEYCAILPKSHGMICAANHLFHTTEIWELGRDRLDLEILRAAQAAIIALRNS